MVDVGVAGLVIGALGLISGGIGAERQDTAARKARKQQDQAQKKNEAAAIGQAREAEQADNRARQKQPDLTVLLDEQTRRNGNAGGIDVDRLLLGRPGALGY